MEGNGKVIRDDDDESLQRTIDSDVVICFFWIINLTDPPTSLGLSPPFTRVIVPPPDLTFPSISRPPPRQTSSSTGKGTRPPSTGSETQCRCSL